MKKHRIVLRLLCLVLLVAAVVGITMVSAKEPVAQVDGLALENMPIVLPGDATDVEKSAAKELQAYLRKMTGKASSITTESIPMESAIYIGKTAFSADKGVTYTDNNLNGEGWAVKVVGDDVIIDGGETRGALYAVYHLLEDHFGVHWWNMWEEYVPELDSAVLPYDYDVRGEPVFEERSIYSNEGMSTLYYARNRLNGWTANAPVAYGSEQSFTGPYHVHTFGIYLPAKYENRMPSSTGQADWRDEINPDQVDWFEVHPEWYAWSDSKQARIDYGQFCFSNASLQEKLTECALMFARLAYESAEASGHLPPTYIGLSPNDAGGFCECDDCEASLAVSGPSGHLLKFLNPIAEAIGEVYPELKVETLAYWQYFEVPLDDTVPAENMVIRLASSDVDLLHDMDHPNNVKVKARLYKWAEILQPGQLLYWDYAITSGNCGIFPNYFKWASDYQKLDEVGALGVFLELQRFNTMEFWDMKHWVVSKLMEDPYQDIYELTKTFLRGYYGEAAAEDIFDYLVFVTDISEDYYRTITFGSQTIKMEWMSAEQILQAYEMFKAAEAKLKADTSISEEDRELYMHRLNAARSPFYYQILNNYNDYVLEMGEQGDPNKLFYLTELDLLADYKDGMKFLRDMELTDDHSGVQGVQKRGNYENLDSRINSYAHLENYKDEIWGVEIENPELPAQIFEDHPGIDEKHIYDFPCHALFDAGTAYGGSFAKYISRIPNGASYEGGFAIKYDQKAIFENQADGVFMERFYTFSESKAIHNTYLGRNLTIGNPLIADGQWHLYRIRDLVAARAGVNKITFFGDTFAVNTGVLQHLLGKPVDMYISMKIEGDPSGTDPKNYGTWYIDRVIFVAPCEIYDINYNIETPATCSNDASRTGMCPVCGKMITEVYEYTRLPHDVSGGYTYDPATESYKAQCSICGEAEYKFCGKLPDELMAELQENNISLEYVYDFDIDDFRATEVSVPEKADPDSPVGRAAYWNLKSKLEHLYMFEISDERPFRDNTNILTRKIWGDEIIADGQYHLYKVEDVPLLSASHNKLILFDWSLQCDFSKVPIMNKKVDVYFSLKVVGDLQFDDVENLPEYYVDRIIIVAPCDNHAAAEYTYDPATDTYVGNCTKCGAKVTKQLSGTELPRQVQDDLAVNGTSIAHVYDWDVDDFTLRGDCASVEDSDSATGRAAKVDSAKVPGLIGKNLVIGQGGSWNLGQISIGQLAANANKGYQIYKLSTSIAPGGTMAFMLSAGGTSLQNYQIQALRGSKIDLYISMKVEGDPYVNPVYYVDRMVAVQTCGTDLEYVTKIPADCESNEIADGVCRVCRKVYPDIQMEGTALGHDFGEFTYDETLGTWTSTCAVCGETKENLPKIVMDDLNAAGMGIEHAHVYTAFNLAGGFAYVDDTDSAVGRAVKGQFPAAKNGLPVTQYPGWSYGTLSAATLQANSGKGYQIYKFSNVSVYNTLNYIWMFNYNLQCHGIRELRGKSGNLYISMKVEGDVTAGTATFYVDRFIFMDDCSQYTVEYEGTEGTCQTAGSMVGYCPVCNKEFTKPGELGGHSFTEYCPDAVNKKKYVAECDYGCGATDEKFDPLLSMEDRLPEELPEHVRSHVLWAYSVPDGYQLSGADEDYRFDVDLGRPVAMRRYYDPEFDTKSSYLDMNTWGGIELFMYPKTVSSFRFAMIPASTLQSNSGKGYVLYELPDLVPFKEKKNNYFYMFRDWVGRMGSFIRDFEEDYYNKPLDFYIYMKVEGDVYCNDPENYPVYYVDQIVIAEKCTPDDTWTVLKEPTCSSFGQAQGNCSVCGQQGVTVNVPMLPHTIENGTIKLQPTCEDNAFVTGSCSVCHTINVSQEVPDTALGHSFTKYHKRDDGTEYAFCDHGCLERYIRDSFNTGSNLQLPESFQEILPVIGKPASHGVSFSDIKSSDWYFSAVKEAVNNKLINGVTATEFRPDETLTVAQAVKLASAYHEMNYTGDVTLENGSGNWYSSYVDYAVENSIVGSDYASMSTAEMNKPIDRSEFVAIFEKAMDEGSLTGYNTVADNAIPDVKTGDANAEAIYKFYRAGILTGSDGKGTFNPHSPIKRSEVATILSRMYNENVRQAIALN